MHDFVKIMLDIIKKITIFNAKFANDLRVLRIHFTRELVSYAHNNHKND